MTSFDKRNLAMFIAPFCFIILIFSVVQCGVSQQNKQHSEDEKAFRAQQPLIIKACAEACNFKMRRAQPCECL